MATEIGRPINLSTPVEGAMYFTGSSVAKRDIMKTGERTRDIQKNKTLRQLWREFTKLMKDFRKAGTRVKMGSIADEISKKMSKVLLKKTQESIDTTYVEIKGVTARSLGYEPKFGHVDEKILKTLRESKPLYEAYAGLSKDLSKDINKVISDSYKLAVSPTMDEMRKVLAQKVNLSKSRLNGIIRSEMTLTSNLAKFQSYDERDPKNEREYTWSGPNYDPRRSSDHCEWIKQQIRKEGGKVKRPRLRQLMKMASDKFNGKKWKYREGLVHVNCRHTPEEVADLG